MFPGGELAKQVSAPLSTWAIFFALAALVTLGPMTRWRALQGKYPNGLPRGLKRN